MDPSVGRELGDILRKFNYVQTLEGAKKLNEEIRDSMFDDMEFIDQDTYYFMMDCTDQIRGCSDLWDVEYYIQKLNTIARKCSKIKELYLDDVEYTEDSSDAYEERRTFNTESSDYSDYLGYKSFFGGFDKKNSTSATFI